MTAIKAEITLNERSLIVPGLQPDESVRVTHEKLGGNDLLMLERHAELYPDRDGPSQTFETEADGRAYAVTVFAKDALVSVVFSRPGAELHD